MRYGYMYMDWDRTITDMDKHVWIEIGSLLKWDHSYIWIDLKIMTKISSYIEMDQDGIITKSKVTHLSSQNNDRNQEDIYIDR